MFWRFYSQDLNFKILYVKFYPIKKVVTVHIVPLGGKGLNCNKKSYKISKNNKKELKKKEKFSKIKEEIYWIERHN